MLRIRTLALSDGVALQNWSALTDEMITQADTNIRIKHQLREQDFSGAVLTTLEYWVARVYEKATLAQFVQLLEKNGMREFAVKVGTEFREPKPSTDPSYNAAAGTQAPVTNPNFQREVTGSLFDIMQNVSNVNEILILLISKEVISVAEMELVQAKPTTSDKLSTLTLLFTRKTADHWAKFKAALMDTGNGHVVERIGQR